MFKNACPFEVEIVKDTGHGLNLQYSHPYTYKTINEFFIKNGLAPKRSLLPGLPGFPPAGKAAGQ